MVDVLRLYPPVTVPVGFARLLGPTVCAINVVPPTAATSSLSAVVSSASVPSSTVTSPPAPPSPPLTSASTTMYVSLNTTARGVTFQKRPPLCHHLVQVRGASQRSIELVVVPVLVVAVLAAIHCIIVINEDLLQSALPIRTISVASPRATVPYTPWAPALCLPLHLQPPLVLHFCFIVGELQLLVTNLLIVEVRRIGTLESLERLRKDIGGVLFDIENSGTSGNPSFRDRSGVREAYGIKWLLDPS